MNRAPFVCLGLMTWLGSFATLTAQEPAVRQVSARGESASGSGANSPRLPFPVGLDTLPAATREMLNKVLKAPTLTALSPADEFASSSEMYLWLLDHPDRVSLAWQRLKIAVIDIKANADGRFCWKDEQGSELCWRSVAQSGEGRIWYAEGKIRAGALLPTVPVKAVAVLRHGIKKAEGGDTMICHQVEVFLQTDSRTATLAMRLLGPAVPRMAQDGAEQMLLFFSAIARHVEQHPERARCLLAEKK
jgi:hypothetical protein